MAMTATAIPYVVFGYGSLIFKVFVYSVCRPLRRADVFNSLLLMLSLKVIPFLVILLFSSS